MRDNSIAAHCADCGNFRRCRYWLCAWLCEWCIEERKRWNAREG